MIEQDGELPNKETEFSQETIKAYAKGCTEVGLGIHSVVEKIRNNGKKPIILIPSRGAVPIFLLAHEAIRSLDPNHFLFDANQVGCYPNDIFELLSRECIVCGETRDAESNKSTQADIILYPFTADVSVEQNGEEWLAKRLRESCTRAFHELIFQDGEYREDLEWYYFLMGKMRSMPDQDLVQLSSRKIIEALKTFPKNENIQIVLIDTVISGRASRDIITAFAALDCKVTPILAVDTRNGGHFQSARKAEIGHAMSWEYMGDQDPFIHFPLITEDKGAALLGVAAVNISNFNKPGFFRSVDNRFKHDFLPQSCVWSLPPGDIRQKYLNLFYSFIDVCLKAEGGQELNNLSEIVKSLKSFISHHGDISEIEIRKLIQTKERGIGKETASHIMSITLASAEAIAWVKDFANSFFKNT